MTLKELIYEEINKIEENNLDELYEFVKRFASVKSTVKLKSGVLGKLKRIKIQAPVDFAADIDLYMSGEKTFDNFH
jgi:hypothetical protein